MELSSSVMVMGEGLPTERPADCELRMTDHVRQAFLAMSVVSTWRSNPRLIGHVSIHAVLSGPGGH